MEYFRQSHYTRSKLSLQAAYFGNMVAFLRRQHPDLTVDEIKAFVNQHMQQSLKRPQMTIVDHPSYGNAEMAQVDLLDYTVKLRQNIITPSGSLYVPPSQTESFLKRKIVSNLKKRKFHKRNMLEAAEVGDVMIEQRENYIQASVKINTNSLPGAFGSMHNCIADIPNYNAVTSLGRHSIMCGYAHAEKMLAGNFYFPSFDHCINYCMQLIRVCPKDVLSIAGQYQLAIPSQQALYDHLLTSLRLYMLQTPILEQQLDRLISAFSPAERTFIYYANCLKTLVMHNEASFRPYLQTFYSTDVVVDHTKPVTDIDRFHPALLAVVSSLNADIIEHKTLREAMVECPAAVQKLIAIATHMQTKLDTLGPLIRTFFCVDCDTADAMEHPNMVRKTVIISDTDSVIFSTQKWVEWYCGTLAFDRPAYEINSFVVMLLVLSLSHVFARLSTSFGVAGGDINVINMKNEFLYPLMLRTPLPKQYAGRVSIQEGFILPKPKNDIKGLSFRSSTFCAETAEAGTNFVNWIFDEVIAHGSVTAAACIQRVLAHEKRVIDSLHAGEMTFLNTEPIRNEKDYVDAATSTYFYWTFWDAVFKPNFGAFILPTKGYKLPVLGGGAFYRDPQYLAQLQAYDPRLHDRLVQFLGDHKRAPTRLLIPMTLKAVPDILRPLINIRAVVYGNSTPFILTLRSLGLAYTNPKDQWLLSDIYG